MVLCKFWTAVIFIDADTYGREKPGAWEKETCVEVTVDNLSRLINFQIITAKR